LDDFMKLFLDDFMVFCDLDTHLSKLWKCFKKCRKYGINLSLEKFAFMVFSTHEKHAYGLKVAGHG
jgi:hypothetical protein